MSNRSLIEINHDYAHQWDDGELMWLFRELVRSGPAMRQEVRDALERNGVTYLTTRHHSEPLSLPATRK